MEIKKEIKNLLLGREEIEFKISSNSTPSKLDLAKQLAEKIKKSESLVVIKNVKGNFGRKDVLVKAFVYYSEKDKDKFELKSKDKKTVSSEPKTPQEMLEAK